MKPKVLPFPTAPTVKGAERTNDQSSEILEMSKYRIRIHRLKGADSVYFINRALDGPEDFTAA